MCVTHYRTTDEVRAHASEIPPPYARNVRFVMYSQLLSDAVDEGLSALGQLTKNTIYELLKTDYGMKDTDIPTRFPEFSSIMIENLGPSVRPLLEFVIERFYHGLRTESPTSTDLDEAINRVDAILRGDPTLDDGSDHASPAARVQNGKTAGDTCSSNRSTLTQPDLPDTNHSISVSTIPLRETGKKMSRTTESRSSSNVNSKTWAEFESIAGADILEVAGASAQTQNQGFRLDETDVHTRCSPKRVLRGCDLFRKPSC